MNNQYVLAHDAATKAAVVASAEYFENTLNGKDNYPCGFAWVKFYPEHKGNTKLGRAERNDIMELGYRKEFTGNGLRLSNPGHYHGQNVDAAYAGAVAYVAKFKEMTGAKIYAQERLD